jgi:hypothetical protein
MRTSGTKYVLMLGAGASLSSDVPTTSQIMKELVEKYGMPSDDAELDDRFDAFWAAATPDMRREYLAPYFDRSPSAGYAVLAELIEEDFFDTIVTFNFDRLLEKALEAGGVAASTYKLIIRGEQQDSVVARLLDAKEPRVKILKMHGSLYSSNTFLFTKEEMLNYPKDIAEVVERVTGRDIMVCGYAFNDQCVSRAFATTGGTVVCVNPSVPSMLKGFIRARNSSSLEFKNTFDEFFVSLRAALFREAKVRKQVRNPFKFLDSYSESEAADYIGRRSTVKSTLEKIEDPTNNTIHILGRHLVGKTSFIRAGVLPRVDETRFLKIYIRCRFGLESSLAEELKRQAGITVQPGDTQDIFKQLAASTDKRVLLVLDQFERAILHAQEEDQRKKLRALLKAFQPVGIDRLTVVCVGFDFRTYQGQLIELCKEPGVGVILLPRVDSRRVEATLRLQARREGIQLDRRVMGELLRKYNESKDTAKPFTLAHIQAVCHLLCAGDKADWVAYEKLDDSGDLSSLDNAINQCDFVELIEDFPPVQPRIVLLEIMKRVSSQGKGKVAEFLRDSCAHLYANQVRAGGT